MDQLPTSPRESRPDPGFLIFLGTSALAIAVVAILNGSPRAGADGPVIRGDAPEDAAEPAPDRAAAWAERRPPLQIPDRDEDSDAASFAVEPPDIIQLGWGWSQPRAEAIPTVCIEFTEMRRDNAQDSNIRISEVRDSYSLARQMNISASVSVKTVAASGSAKASFAKNSNISSSAVTYLVDAEVMNSAIFAGPVEDRAPEGGTRAVRLTEDAAALARTDLERFQDICGEGFVSSLKTGARAYMLAPTKTSSREDRETVRASVKGSGWGVKVSAAASGSTATTDTRFERTMTFYQQGGNATTGTDYSYQVPADAAQGAGETKTLAAGDLPRNAEEAILRISKLAYAAAEAGKIFEAQVTPYQVLENFPDRRDILAEEDEQDEIAAIWGAYATLYADLRTALEDPDDWAVPVRRCADGACETGFEPLSGNPDAMALVERLQDMTLIAQDQIQDAADRCIAHEEHCDFDARTVRSPYAVRASMPVLIPLVPADNTARQARARAQMDEAVKVYDPYKFLQPVDWKLLAELPARWEQYLAVNTPAAADARHAKSIAALTGDDHLTIHLREPSQGRCMFGSRTPGCISNAEIRGWAARTGLASMVTADRDGLKTRIEACKEAGQGSVLLGDGDDPGAPTVWFPPAVHIVNGAPVCTSTALIKPEADGAKAPADG